MTRMLLGAHVTDGTRAAIARHAGTRARFDAHGFLAAGASPLVALHGGSEPPIDEQRLAEFAEHDVVGLDVAVYDAAVVSVRNRIADADEVIQQAVEFEPGLAVLVKV